MDNGNVWDIVHAVLKKESRGNVIKPNQFSHILQQCHIEYYNQQYEKWAGSQTALDSLTPFLIFDESITITATTYSISALTGVVTRKGYFKHPVAARYSSSNYKCDIVTPLEWNEWAGDSVMKGTSSFPLIMIDNQNINISPTLAGQPDQTVKISYLVGCTPDVTPYDSSDNIDSGTATSTTPNKLVQTGQNFLTTVKAGMVVRNTTDNTEARVTAVDSNTSLSLDSDIMADEETFVIYDSNYGSNNYYLPFFDYYIDSNYKVNYLYNGQVHTLGANEMYRDGTTAGSVTGVSHELKWRDHDKVNIITMILEKLGIAMQSPDITQYAMALGQKQNVM